jgi:uncharacterized protein YggT (Ycf19 family)
MSDEPNSVRLDEERRLASQQEVKASMDEEVKARLKSEPVRAAPTEQSALASLAHALQHKAVSEAAATERELERGRTAARVSQVMDYAFYLIYGVISLQFLLRLMGARAGNGFVQFIASLSAPLLAPFERIVGTPSVGAVQLQLSYLFALIVYLSLHLAINGMFRLLAHRKVTV